MESQIPQYNANVTTKCNSPTDTTYIISPNGTYVPLASKDTLYSIWIGTNDVGSSALLTDPLKDVSIVNMTACVFDWVKSLYDQGARNFLIQNVSGCISLSPLLQANLQLDDTIVPDSHVFCDWVYDQVLEPAT
ncbi:hypothetical protein FS749_003572 [Ceratobasidium sp. UAMH 11750]|nr:hypothetical protein FS749_003572 [Ceratobasidium sp. UAMH 11750]